MAVALAVAMAEEMALEQAARVAEVEQAPGSVTATEGRMGRPQATWAMEGVEAMAPAASALVAVCPGGAVLVEVVKVLVVLALEMQAEEAEAVRAPVSQGSAEEEALGRGSERWEMAVVASEAARALVPLATVGVEAWAPERAGASSASAVARMGAAAKAPATLAVLMAVVTAEGRASWSTPLALQPPRPPQYPRRPRSSSSGWILGTIRSGAWS